MTLSYLGPCDAIKHDHIEHLIPSRHFLHVLHSLSRKWTPNTLESCDITRVTIDSTNAISYWWSFGTEPLSLTCSLQHSSVAYFSHITVPAEKRTFQSSLLKSSSMSSQNTLEPVGCARQWINNGTATEATCELSARSICHKLYANHNTHQTSVLNCGSMIQTDQRCYVSDLFRVLPRVGCQRNLSVHILCVYCVYN